MKARILLLFLASGVISVSMSQNTIDLTFTAVDNTGYIRLDSIKVLNRTQGDSVKIYWPDTTLAYEIIPGDRLMCVGYAMKYPVGIQPIRNQEQPFQLLQGYPNPARDQSVISVYLPSKGPVHMIVADVRGRNVTTLDRVFEEGTHSLRFKPGDDRIYFLTARWNGIIQSIKILTEGATGGKTCRLDYIGPNNEGPSLKQSPHQSGLVVHESGILVAPEVNSTYTFQFATNIPCPGIPTVTYEGQVYNTIQIYSQCWLKENLNVGTIIPGYQDQTDNGIVEKYCYLDEPDSCIKYGGLYQWDEMMQYTAQQGAQGICPPGWHLPTDEEWKLLEGVVDSQNGIGDAIWDLNWGRGYDAGRNLKTTGGWYLNGNGTDLFGFSGLPVGFRDDDSSIIGEFFLVGVHGYWWSSTESELNYPWYRSFHNESQVAYRSDYSRKEFGYGVRCLRGY